MSLTLPELSLHDAVGHLLRHYHYYQILDVLTDHLSEMNEVPLKEVYYLYYLIAKIREAPIDFDIVPPSGIQLDNFGQLWGVQREGMSDTEYRMAIRSEIEVKTNPKEYDGDMWGEL